jgi:hypothetical protein
MMKSLMLACTLAIALASLGRSPALAQTAPGWSRGQQNLAISYAECLRRANQAIQNEGYRTDYAGGNAVVGIKSVHTAVIICSPAPDAKMLVQIVVASNGEGGGVERQRLQAEMGRSVTTSSRGCQTPVGSWAWWNGGTVTFADDGSARHPSGAAGQWQRMNDGSYHVHWGPQLNTDDYFVLSADGMSMPGRFGAGQTGTSHRQGSCP